MKRLKTLAFFLAAHLAVVASLVTLAEAWLHGSGTAAYAGWTGGLVVAVWTLPMAVFAGYFIGAEGAAREAAREAAEERPVGAAAKRGVEAGPGNG